MKDSLDGVKSELLGTSIALRAVCSENERLEEGVVKARKERDDLSITNKAIVEHNAEPSANNKKLKESSKARRTDNEFLMAEVSDLKISQRKLEELKVEMENLQIARRAEDLKRCESQEEARNKVLFLERPLEKANKSRVEGINGDRDSEEGPLDS